MRIIMFLILVFINIKIYSQEKIDSVIYENISKHKIGKYHYFNEYKQTKYYYKITLYSDSTFSYLNYKILPKQGVENIKNIDSIYIKGEYSLSNKKYILFKHKIYFKNDMGIFWVLKKRAIIVRGYNTRRTRLYRLI